MYGELNETSPVGNQIVLLSRGNFTRLVSLVGFQSRVGVIGSPASAALSPAKYGDTPDPKHPKPKVHESNPYGMYMLPIFEMWQSSRSQTS